MKEEDKQIQNEEYNEYVKQVTPTNNLFGNMVKAFIVGGVICVIGQVILNVAMNRFGLDKETAGSWCSMLLILLSIILTGFNIYPTFAKGEVPEHWCQSPDLPIPWLRRQSSSKKRVRCLESDVRYLRSQGRSSSMEFLQAGC